MSTHIVKRDLGRQSYSRSGGGSRPGGFKSSRPAGGGFAGGYSPRPQGSFSRGGFSGGRGGGRGGGGGRRGPADERIDVSRFINKAVITTEEPFVPVHTFADFAIVEELKKNIIAKGYREPTPIQDKSVPEILNGRDVVGIANTGTGKTAAFLIPLINKVLLNPNKEQILIVVPTRELAIQIDEELKGFTRMMKIFSVCCVGGMSLGKQISDLRYFNQFIIGTPGRLKDLIERGFIKLPNFKSVVLDEADRMLDMGFIADMRFMMDRMPKDRQTLFFSATLSKDIEKLIHDFLRNPISISVKVRDTSKNIDQDVVNIPPGKHKIEVLNDLLIQPGFNKVLIFGRTKHGVEKLMVELKNRGFKAESIHGDKNHSRRQLALRMFKDDKIQALIATDVAARGLDIAGVSHVINYDLPATYDDYVHRIGRTGRAGKKGKALTFIG